MRILVVDESDRISNGLSGAVGQQDERKSIVRTRDLCTAEQLLHRDNRFDVALVAVATPHGETADIPTRLKVVCPDLVIVVITGEDSPEAALDLVRLGIQDCIPRCEVTPRRLLRTIELARERHRREQQLRKLACTDTLTGSLNRRGLAAAAQDLHRTAIKMNEVTALMTVDLDGFKRLNDRYGHPVGDLVLRTACRRIGHCIRDNDVVGRAGGDEFWIILNCVGKAGNAPRIAQKVLDQVAEPMLLDGYDLHTTASIGIALLPCHCNTVDDWVRKSDQALYDAKKNGRNSWHQYRPPAEPRPVTSDLPVLGATAMPATGQ